MSISDESLERDGMGFAFFWRPQREPLYQPVCPPARWQTVRRRQGLCS